MGPILAFLISLFDIVLAVEALKFLSVKFQAFLPPVLTRKLLHIGAGLFYILHWPLFYHKDKIWCVLVVVVMTLNFLLIGF